MFEHSSTGLTIEVLRKGLNATALRHATISDNIANADTPRFKRSSVAFEEDLRRSLKEPGPQEIPANTTHDWHYSFEETAPPLSSVKSRIRMEIDTYTRNDKSNYYLEEEMVNLWKNSERYMIMSQLVGDEFKELKGVIQKGGSR